MKSKEINATAEFDFCKTTWDKVVEKAKAFNTTPEVVAKKIIDGFNQPKKKDYFLS